MRLLDLYTITQRAYPELVKPKIVVRAPEPVLTQIPVAVTSVAPSGIPQLVQTNVVVEAAPKARQTPLLLLAEDSNFFRKQVKTYFEEAGYRTADYPDGLAAWNALKSGKQEFDLVVTDVEMPNMNGLQLCRAIKSDPKFSKLPVIALTSLAGDEDVRQGKAVGVDDYQVKMDREKLLESVTRLLAGQSIEEALV